MTAGVHCRSRASLTVPCSCCVLLPSLETGCLQAKLCTADRSRMHCICKEEVLALCL